MFKIIEGDFKNSKYSNEEYLDNWPMLYILENGKKAYIGESNHVKTRMTQHTTNEYLIRSTSYIPDCLINR